MNFCEIDNFAYGEINERSFSNPHPWSLSKILFSSVAYFPFGILRQLYFVYTGIYRQWVICIYHEVDYDSVLLHAMGLMYMYIIVIKSIFQCLSDKLGTIHYILIEYTVAYYSQMPL